MAGRLARAFAALGGGAALLALWTIWGRPGPHVLYGTDAAYYAQVAKELLTRSNTPWVAPTIVGEPFYEHPPGGPYLLAAAGWLAGRIDAATAVTAARLAATGMLVGCVGTASRLAGAAAAGGAALSLCCASGFLFESQNPMLEIFLGGAASLSLWATLGYADARTARAGWWPLVAAASLATLAAWCKGPVAGVLLGPWAALWACGRLRPRRAACLLGCSVALGAASVLAFELWRAHLQLPSYFLIYAKRQLWPSIVVGRHHPEASGWYYLPMWWRWYAVPLVLSMAAALLLVVRRPSAAALLHRATSATTRRPAVVCFVVGAAWWILTVFAFAVVRQKYGWYVHAGAPGLALMCAAGASELSTRLGRTHFARLRTRFDAALLAICLVAIATTWLRPDLLRTRRPMLDAMHAVSPQCAARLANRRVAIVHEPALWRSHYIARFLWDATLVPAEADPEVLLCLRAQPGGQTLLQVCRHRQ